MKLELKKYVLWLLLPSILSLQFILSSCGSKTMKAPLPFVGYELIVRESRTDEHVDVVSHTPLPLTSKRIALVIGNAAYAEKPLVNPVNDATDMADVLEKLGFEVILKTDANLDTMIKSMRDFASRLSNNSVSLFYFSGHGNQHNSENYLIPVGAKIDVGDDFQREALSANEVVEKMEDKNREGVNLVFLDACRENLNGRKSSKSSGASKGLTLMGSRFSGFLIAYATAPGEVADDNPTERNAIYTKHLLAVLREMPQKNIFTLLTEVRQRVSQETHKEQIPREENALMTADFCLALGKCESTSLPTAKEPSTYDASGGSLFGDD